MRGWRSLCVLAVLAGCGEQSRVTVARDPVIVATVQVLPGTSKHPFNADIPERLITKLTPEGKLYRFFLDAGDVLFSGEIDWEVEILDKGWLILPRNWGRPKAMHSIDGGKTYIEIKESRFEYFLGPGRVYRFGLNIKRTGDGSFYVAEEGKSVAIIEVDLRAM